MESTYSEETDIGRLPLGQEQEPQIDSVRDILLHRERGRIRELESEIAWLRRQSGLQKGKLEEQLQIRQAELDAL